MTAAGHRRPNKTRASAAATLCVAAACLVLAGEEIPPLCSLCHQLASWKTEMQPPCSLQRLINVGSGPHLTGAVLTFTGWGRFRSMDLQLMPQSGSAGQAPLRSSSVAAAEALAQAVNPPGAGPAAQTSSVNPANADQTSSAASQVKGSTGKGRGSDGGADSDTHSFAGSHGTNTAQAAVQLPRLQPSQALNGQASPPGPDEAAPRQPDPAVQKALAAAADTAGAALHAAQQRPGSSPGHQVKHHVRARYGCSRH